MGKSKVLIAVRIRGPNGLSAETEYNLRLLNLKRANNAAIFPNDESVKGMLRKVNSYITWGEATPEILARLLKIGEPREGVKVEEELSKLGVTGLEEFARKLSEGEIGFSVVKRLYKPTFQLSPPRGGFGGSIKRPRGQKGVLGYAGEDLAKLLNAMC